MATHSNVLAWRIPGTGKPGGVPSMGSHRVGHDWSNLARAIHPNLSPKPESQECRYLREGKKWMSQFKQTEQNVPWLCFFVLLGGLDNAHLHWLGSWVGWCSLALVREVFFTLRIQILITSRDTLTDMYGNNILPSIWASPFKLICKIKHLTQLVNSWAEVGFQFFSSLPSFPPPVSFLHTKKLLNWILGELDRKK